MPDDGQGRMFRHLCAAGLLAYTSYAICRTPLLPLFARELGASPAMTGFVVAASTVTGVVLKLPAGACSDLFGRRRLLIAASLVFAVTPFAYLGVATLPLLLVVRAVHGSATAIFGPVASASIADVAPRERRALWLGTYATIQGAGQAFGQVVAGFLLAVSTFRTSFAVAGLIAIASPLIVRTWPRDVVHATDRGRLADLAGGISAILREPLIVVASLTQSAQYMLNGAVSAFLPLFGREVLGLTVAQLGMLFGLQTASTLAARPIVAAIADRAGRRGVVGSGLLLCSGGVAGLSVARDPLLVIPAVVVYAIGVAATTAAMTAFITDVAPRERYGAAHGVFGTIYDVGDALGPIMGGIIASAFGYDRMLRLMAGVVAVAACVFLVVSSVLSSPPHPGSDT